jgi:hypothetical protein
MSETFGGNDCGRAGQLVGYIYGESDAAERAGFERHLPGCAACRDEVAAFTQVRSSVAGFRAELLQAAPAVSLAEFAAGADAGPAAAPPVRGAHASPHGESEAGAPHGLAPPVAAPRASARAAWGALGQFFRLSPLWLRASTAAAALALCALALLAVVKAEVSFGGTRFALRTGTRPASEPPAAPPALSAEVAALRAELESLAAERDAAVRELREARGETGDGRAADPVAAEFERATATQRSSATRHERRPRRAPPARAAAPARATRRTAEEEDLPRLLDLLGDAN